MGSAKVELLFWSQRGGMMVFGHSPLKGTEAAVFWLGCLSREAWLEDSQDSLSPLSNSPYSWFPWRHSLEDTARDYELLDRRWRTQGKGIVFFFIPSCWRPRVWKGEKKEVRSGYTEGITENDLDSPIMGYISETEDSGPYGNWETGVQKVPYQPDPEGFNWVLSGRWGISPKILQSKSWMDMQKLFSPRTLSTPLLLRPINS